VGFSLWNSAAVPIEENSRKTGFLARINTTRREFLGKPSLPMNLVVKGGFADRACSKKGSPAMIRIHHQRLSTGAGEKRNYERTFVAKILAGAVFVNGTVAPPDGFITMFMSVLAGTGAT
jgi:hypothetical protein